MQWDAEFREEKKQEQRTAGHEALQHLLRCYTASKPFTGKDLCTVCWYLAEAGTPGGRFRTFALRPDQKSEGNYQQHLDRVLPEGPNCFDVEVPMSDRNKTFREVRTMPVGAVQESIAEEIRENPSIIDQADEGEWGQQYEEHPLVIAAANKGLPKPVPIGVYLDAVAYRKSAAAGRTDSVLGLRIVNLVTGKRHNYASFRSGDFCACGCGGGCSIFPLLLGLAYCLEILSRNGPRARTR